MKLVMMRFLFCFPASKIASAGTNLHEIERCVLCSKQTPYHRGDLIDIRDDEDFVSGVGPVCPSCLEKARKHHQAA